MEGPSYGSTPLFLIARKWAHFVMTCWKWWHSSLVPVNQSSLAALSEQTERGAALQPFRRAHDWVLTQAVRASGCPWHRDSCPPSQAQWSVHKRMRALRLAMAHGNGGRQFRLVGFESQPQQGSDLLLRAESSRSLAGFKMLQRDSPKGPRPRGSN